MLALSLNRAVLVVVVAFALFFLFVFDNEAFTDLRFDSR